MKINEHYLDFYMKKRPCLHLPFKLVNDRWIDLFFEKLDENKSSLTKKSLCIFNPFSLTNILRCNENDKAFVDESKKTTASYEKLENDLFSFHDKISENCPIIVDNIASTRSVYAKEYPNDDNSVFGLVGFEFVFDTSKKPAEYYAKILARKANLLNYNIVDFNVEDEDQKIEYDGKTYVLSRFDIQFEATYQDKIDLKIDKYVYHVTTKNNAEKILEKGLLPNNANMHGFKYPNRIYVFVDINHTLDLASPYASSSKKKNKKFIKNDELHKLVSSYEILIDKLNGKVVDTKEFSILKIDLNKAGNIKLYRDNTFEIDGEFVAAYSEQAIPPKAISKICDFSLN